MAAIRRGDIWYIESGFSTGSEQRPGRPAIVVSNDTNNYHSSTVEVVYLTTQPKHDLPTHVNIHSLSRESIAICEQITTVAVERLGNYRGRVTEAEMHGIEAAMLISLGLDAGCDKDVSDETPPMLEARLAEAEAKCAVLQQMYDALLNKLLKVS